MPADAEIGAQALNSAVRIQLIHWLHTTTEPVGAGDAADHLGIQRKAAERCLRELAELGVLDRHPSPQGERGYRYTLNTKRWNRYRAAIFKYVGG